MYEDQILIIKYCMQEFGDKFPEILAKVLNDSGIKVGVRTNYEIKEIMDGEYVKYVPEFSNPNIELDCSIHDSILNKLISRFCEDI